GRPSARRLRLGAMFFRSLRFRLPALFLLGILLAAVVATLIAVRFFQSYTHTHAASELRREAAGIVTLYEGQAGVGHVSPGNLQLALGGDRIYWVPAVAGASLLAGPVPQLPRSEVPLARVVHRSSPAFDLDVQGSTYRRWAGRPARRDPGRRARRRQARVGAPQPLAPARVAACDRVRDRDSRRAGPRRL